MLIRMPYLFDAVVLERRCRHASHSYFGDWHFVEVPELTAEDAPVAMRWTETRGPGRAEIPVHRETRWFDERHWMPFGRDSDPSCAPTAADALGGGTTIFEPAKRALSYNSYQAAALRDFIDGKLRPFDEDHVNEVFLVDREGGMRSAERAASRLLSVDGVLYVPVHEPRYRLAWRDNLVGGEQRPSAWISAEMSGGYRSRGGNRSPLFRADRLGDLVDFLRSSRPRHAIRSRVTIDVLLPQSVNFMDDRDAVCAAAQALVGQRGDAFGGVFEKLRSMDAASAAEWFHMRDRLAADDGSEESAEAIAGHVEGFVRGLQDGHDKETAELALARWRVRPVTENSLRL